MEKLSDIWNHFVQYCVNGLKRVASWFVNWLMTIGDALSQFANVFCFFGDNANESVSGRAHRLKDKYRFWGIMRAVIDWCASPLELDHCKASHDADVARAARLLRSQGS